MGKLSRQRLRQEANSNAFQSSSNRNFGFLKCFYHLIYCWFYKMTHAKESNNKSDIKIGILIDLQAFCFHLLQFWISRIHFEIWEHFAETNLLSWPSRILSVRNSNIAQWFWQSKKNDFIMTHLWKWSIEFQTLMLIQQTFVKLVKYQNVKTALCQEKRPRKKNNSSHF